MIRYGKEFSCQYEERVRDESFKAIKYEAAAGDLYNLVEHNNKWTEIFTLLSVARKHLSCPSVSDMLWC
jgi:hypothetical protein